MKRPSLHIHTTHTRDAALLRLRRVNRWVIMGSIVLAGVLTDVAANAFPGRTKSASGSSSESHKKHHSKGSAPTGVLAPPGSAPEHTGESSSGSSGSAPPSEGSSGEGSSSSEGSAGGGGSSGGESPSGEAHTPETSSAPEASSGGQSSSEGQSSEPSGEASAPVVSGGS